MINNFNANLKEFYDALFDAIENITKTTIDKTGVDRTYKGKISAVKGSGIYNVVINNQTYTVKYKNAALNKGDDVWCTVACGNWNNIVVIPA